MTARLIAYTRVSTDEQDLGLAAQRATIEASAGVRDYEVIDWVEDHGYSGGLPPEKRPALRDAMVRVRAGEADGIVVAKLDRLSRSLLDFATLVDERSGLKFVILDLGVDTSDPVGRFIAHILAAFAQWERELIGQRTKSALAAKREREPDWSPTRKILLPEDLRQEIAQRVEAGERLTHIARDLNNRGVPTVRGGQCWRSSTVRAVVNSVARDEEDTRG